MLAMTGYPEQSIQKKEGGKGIHQLLGPIGQTFTRCASAPLSFQADSGSTCQILPVSMGNPKVGAEKTEQGCEVRALPLCLQGISCIFSRRGRQGIGTQVRLEGSGWLHK